VPAADKQATVNIREAPQCLTAWAPPLLALLSGTAHVSSSAWLDSRLLLGCARLSGNWFCVPMRLPEPGRFSEAGTC